MLKFLPGFFPRLCRTIFQVFFGLSIVNTPILLRKNSDLNLLWKHAFGFFGKNLKLLMTRVFWVYSIAMDWMLLVHATFLHFNSCFWQFYCIILCIFNVKMLVDVGIFFSLFTEDSLHAKNSDWSYSLVI
jgi:hypothetical protein